MLADGKDKAGKRNGWGGDEARSGGGGSPAGWGHSDASAEFRRMKDIEIPTIGKKSRKIFVADQSSDILEPVREQLDALGYSVNGSTKWEDAKDAIVRERMDLLVIEDELPGMDCRAMADEMKARCPAAKIILLNAWAGGQIPDDVREDGRVSVLQKPFSARMLKAAVENALSN